ncbi:unnamed protein product, partial [Thelazia callipaeda]|uniref:Very low-density lipoprotein receptor n=1 Tax=Thelazia callipaeda TaxID=103827 RepID=A0A0N5D0I0_THECL
DLKCDRVNDCGDESDEEDCSSSCPDQENWFRCTKASCIPIKQRCDGNVDCPEEDDEMNCSKDASHCRRDEFLCDLHRCIPLTMKCDGVPDCRDGTDEPVVP